MVSIRNVRDIYMLLGTVLNNDVCHWPYEALTDT